MAITHENSRGEGTASPSMRKACPRCEGLLVRDILFDLSSSVEVRIPSLRCVACGNQLIEKPKDHDAQSSCPDILGDLTEKSPRA